MHLHPCRFDCSDSKTGGASESSLDQEMYGPVWHGRVRERSSLVSSCTCSRRIKNTYYCYYPIQLTRNGLNVKFKSSLQPLPLRALLWWPLYVHEANEPAIADEYRISRSIIMVLPIRAIDRSWRRLWSIYNHLKVSSYPYRLCNITRIAKRVNRCRHLAGPGVTVVRSGGAHFRGPPPPFLFFLFVFKGPGQN